MGIGGRFVYWRYYMECIAYSYPIVIIEVSGLREIYSLSSDHEETQNPPRHAIVALQSAHSISSIPGMPIVDSIYLGSIGVHASRCLEGV